MQIYFKTNKGKAIGPYGTESDPDKLTFKASYNGAPLLYAEGYRGLWVYYLKFYFHGNYASCYWVGTNYQTALVSKHARNPYFPSVLNW